MNQLQEDIFDASTNQSWWQLSSIQIGGAVCLPVIMVGQTLAKNYGFFSAILAICVGNLFLLLLGMAVLRMTMQNKVSTIENAKRYFGSKGTPILALTMIVCLGGWFAIQLNVMTLSLQEMSKIFFGDYFAGDWGRIAGNFLLGLLITGFAFKGIQSLNYLSTYSMPLLIGTIAYALFSHSPTPQILSESSYSWGGITLVIAASIAIIADMPTYYRFSKSNRDGMISILMLFIIALPIIEIVGVYIGVRNPHANIIDALAGGGSQLWHFWVGLFLLLAGWTTNNTNLYSVAISLRAIMPNASQPFRIGLIGILAIAVSCFNILEHFETVLEGMTLAIGSMSAVIITRYVLCDQQFNYTSNIFCWVLGTCLGIFTLTNVFSLTTIPILDAWIVSAIATFFLIRMEKFDFYNKMICEK
jgi:purine-cytosine permease-like protein